MATPNLALPTSPSGATDISAAYNEAVQIIDALLPLVVEDKDLNAPPTTVSGDIGKRWIIGTVPTGAWAGKAGQVALCTDANAWKYIVAPLYTKATVLDEVAAEYRREPTGWEPV